ncbi:MAG: hypothetical protein AB7V46_24850, partial [Thermomicrobiales bacterium]
RTFRAESSALFLAPQVERPDDQGPDWYGFGSDIEVDAEGRVSRYGKEGMNAGVCSLAAWYPQRDGAAIVLANQMCDVWAMVREIEAIFT